MATFLSNVSLPSVDSVSTIIPSVTSAATSGLTSILSGSISGKVQLPSNQPDAVSPSNVGYSSASTKKIGKITPVYRDNDPTYTTIEYPVAGLGSTRYPHYVMFFINDYLKSSALADTATVDVATQTKLNSTANQRTAGTGIANTVMNAGGAAVEKVTLGAVNAGNIKQFSATKKRLKQAICLPMPIHIKAGYSASYQETEAVGAVGGAILAAIQGEGKDAVGTALLGSAPAIANAGIEVAKSSITGIIRKTTGINAAPLAKAVGNISPEMASQIASKLSGAIINKRQEQLFKNMNFRSHQFSYLLIPRNITESKTIHDIIKLFKTFMHPDMSAGLNNASLLITPAEFDIQYMYGSVENADISRIATCVLTSLDVDYTAIGEFIAFDLTDHPVAITLNMTFTEMEPLTRKMVLSYGM